MNGNALRKKGTILFTRVVTKCMSRIPTLYQDKMPAKHDSTCLNVIKCMSDR